MCANWPCVPAAGAERCPGAARAGSAHKIVVRPAERGVLMGERTRAAKAPARNVPAKRVMAHRVRAEIAATERIGVEIRTQA